MGKLKKLAFTLWSRCNGSCGYCFNKERAQEELQLNPQQEITIPEFKSIIDQAIPLGLEEIELSGGEPLLEPETVLKMIKLAKSKGVHTGIFTNGSLLTPEITDRLYDSKLDWIRISLGGYDFRTHSLERGGTPQRFDTIISGIKASIGKGIKTRLFVPITKNTFSFIEKTCDFIANEFPGLEHVVFDSYIPNGVPEKDRKFQMSSEQHSFAIDSLLKSKKKHEGKVKIIPFYGCFEFLSPEWHGEEVLKSPCGKERLAFLSNGDVTPCLCTLDVLENFRQENFDLRSIVERMPHPSHYDFSSYAPCSDCNKYELCHDSWCPSLTINGHGNYDAPPSTCPAVRTYESLFKEGTQKDEARKIALKHNRK